MILKKPYAFLIKHFKSIHFIITMLMAYLIFKSYKLINFFNLSVANNYTAIESGQVAGSYINYFMYFAIILILGLLLAIYYLLSHKNKPRKYYINGIVFYIILFVAFSIFYNYINTLNNANISSQSLRAYRDISVIAIIPQIIFAIYSFVTSIGFNIKKFNFGEDLKELEIDSEDSEEFEFTFQKDNYKTRRSIRKFIREFRYYVKENTLVISVIGIVVFVVLVVSLFLNREVYKKTFNTSENLLHKSFNINVVDSIISNLSFDGSEIKSDKYYVAVKIKVTNNSTTSQVLDYSNFRLIVNKRAVNPVLTNSIYFKDYANPYHAEKISSSSTKTITLVYEINKNEIKSSYTLKIYRGASVKPGEIISKYSDVSIKPILITEKTKANSVELNEKLDFLYSNIGNSSFLVKSFMFGKSYQFSYESCVTPLNCRMWNDIITVDQNIRGDYKLLLVLDYELTIDKDAPYFLYISSTKAFMEDFAKVRYIINDKEYTSRVFFIESQNLKDKMVLQVASNVNSASNVYLDFVIRNKTYEIVLK